MIGTEIASAVKKISIPRAILISLGGVSMERSEAAYLVERLQDYIEKRMGEPITMRQLADAAGYSPWYLSRIFKEVTGKSPFEYIRSRRLTQAALVLRDGDRRVLDVALDFVFDSQEGFTRAFSREFGIAPGRYQARTPAIHLFLPESAYQSYRALHPVLTKQEGTKAMAKAIFVQVVERPERKCLLKRGQKAEGYFDYCAEAGCDVWGLLSSVKEALYEPVGMWLPGNLRPAGTSEYVQGVELPMEYDKPVPDGYELVTFPPCTMMVFQGEPYGEEDLQEAIGEVWEHISRFDPRLYGFRWAPEAGPRFQLSPMGYRGYIEARPVERC